MLEEAITSGEIGKQSYTGYTVFIFRPWIFMSNIKENWTEIVIVHLLDLEDGLLRLLM